MTTLFSVSAALTAFLGVVWLFFPAAMLALWGVEQHANAVTIYMGQRYGGLFFGYTVILWLARRSPPSPTRRAILAAGFAATAVLAVISLFGVLTGTVGPAAWTAVVVEALLAVAFGYFYWNSR
jgi:nitrate reductase gamma subunit